MGKADATSCQTTEAAMVVMRAAMRPVLRKVWNPSETPRTLLPVPISTLRVQTRATKNMDETTQIWRPIMNPGRLRPPSRKRTSQVILAHLESPCLSLVILVTAKKAICMPSRRPMRDMRMKKTTTATPGGTPFHTVVFPWKRAVRVMAKA